MSRVPFFCPLYFGGWASLDELERHIEKLKPQVN